MKLYAYDNIILSVLVLSALNQVLAYAPCKQDYLATWLYFCFYL